MTLRELKQFITGDYTFSIGGIKFVRIPKTRWEILEKSLSPSRNSISCDYCQEFINLNIWQFLDTTDDRWVVRYYCRGCSRYTNDYQIRNIGQDVGKFLEHTGKAVIYVSRFTLGFVLLMNGINSIDFSNN